MGKQRYYLIEPDLSSGDCSPAMDTQVRCLALIIERIHDIAHVPSEARFHIVVQRRHGGAGPAIGMLADDDLGAPDAATRLTFTIMSELREYIQGIGVARLEQEAAGIALTWRDVLRRS